MSLHDSASQATQITEDPASPLPRPHYLGAINMGPVSAGAGLAQPPGRRLADRDRSLLADVCAALSTTVAPAAAGRFTAVSDRLVASFVADAARPGHSMIPSQYACPARTEAGTFLAVDIGGSNLRMARVVLSGAVSAGDAVEVSAETCAPITSAVRELDCDSLISWLAHGIAGYIVDQFGQPSLPDVVAAGLSWSFPIEKRSHGLGSIADMGKGFRASGELRGKEPAVFLADAVNKELRARRVGSVIRFKSLVNDSIAALLGHHYINPSVKALLINGTGLNAAAFITPSLPLDGCQHNGLAINTELGTYGEFLHTSAWDNEVRVPGTSEQYMVLERFCSGRYIGDFARVAIRDSVSGALKRLNMPVPESGIASVLLGESASWSLSPETLGNLAKLYPLDDASLIRSVNVDLEAGADATTTTNTNLTTDTIFASVSAEINRDYSKPETLGIDWHATNPSAADRVAVALLIKIAHATIERSLTHTAAGLFALLSVGLDIAAATDETVLIGCNGSLINKLPGFRLRCQELVNAAIGAARRGGPSHHPAMNEHAPGDHSARLSRRDIADRLPYQVKLEEARDGTLIGAAVSAAMSSDTTFPHQ